MTPNALASNALYRYRNVVLRNCNAHFDFQMTLFDVLDNLVLLYHNCVCVISQNSSLVCQNNSLNGRLTASWTPECQLIAG